MASKVLCYNLCFNNCDPVEVDHDQRTASRVFHFIYSYNYRLVVFPCVPVNVNDRNINKRTIQIKKRVISKNDVRYVQNIGTIFLLEDDGVEASTANR